MILLAAVLAAILGTVCAAPSNQRAELEAVLSMLQDAVEQAYDENEQVDDRAHAAWWWGGKKEDKEKKELDSKQQRLQMEKNKLNAQLETASGKLCTFASTITDLCASYTPSEESTSTPPGS